MTRDETSPSAPSTFDLPPDLDVPPSLAQPGLPLVSTGSFDSVASTETVRPAITGITQPNVIDTVATQSTSNIPRSPLLRRQPSAPSTLQHSNVPGQSSVVADLISPRLHSVSEHRGTPSITSATSSIHRSSTRRNPRLRTPLARLTSYSHGETAYSSDEDSDSAAEADMEAVQAELERNWAAVEEPSTNTGTIRRRRRHSAGTSRGKGPRDEIYDTSTIRRNQFPSQQGFYARDSDGDEGTPYTDDERPHSRIHRHVELESDGETDSDGIPDSEASFTLKDRQDAINITHPFGLKIWKPALYKKNRSVQRTAEGEIHSLPGRWPDRKIRVGNVLWTLVFGWWMCLITAAVALVLLITTWWSGGAPYAFVLFGLAKYLFYPFGRFIELTPDEAYAEEDEGEGRSISEYERYGAVDLERGRHLGILSSSSPIADHRRGLIGRRRGHSTGSWGAYSERDSLLGGPTERTPAQGEEDTGPRKRRFFGRGQWSLGRIVFFLSFYLVIGPLLLLVCGLCWLIVFTLPMAKVTSVLVSHLRRHPLSMSFHSDLRTAASRRPGTPSAQVLICTYRATGWEYYKYTVDGTNIFFVNLMFIVFFTIFDEYFLAPFLHHSTPLTHPALIFTLALASIVPLAYFIGMAVASISAQSSMGMGAAINAFFGSVVEVFLYSVALTQGKSRLVEGSVVGSIFAGTLMMPGASMLCGALRRKTQRFNAKSAGVTSTMLLFSVIGAFAPTLFYQIYGTYELRCSACENSPRGLDEDCQRCYWDQGNALTDPFYISSVKPFSYICAVFLVTSYVIGLWFSLRTHAAQIWEIPSHIDDHAPLHHQSSLANWRNNIPDEPFLKRIGERMVSAGHVSGSPVVDRENSSGSATAATAAMGTNGSAKRRTSQEQPRLSTALTPEDNAMLVRNVAEVAAAAATLAIHHSQVESASNPTPQTTPRPPPIQTGVFQPSSNVPFPVGPFSKRTPEHRGSTQHDWDQADLAEVGMGGGHDAPNWSRTKSSMILLGATILYAVIAGMLPLLRGGTIDEKFLGFTLFALVPNTTEFLNAISFALNGNIALSMEIGSAYALQVCLLQIPALVAVSAFLNSGKLELPESTFTLIFPRWDLITVILCVFLLAYMYGEGKSNYFKGSILMLAYGVVLMGGFYTPRYPDDVVGVAGLERTG